MHNGMLATLDDVLAFYDRGRSENENVANGGGGRGRRGNNAPDGALATLDRDFRGVRDMSTQEQRDIVAFLHALTDEVFDRTIPARVPSGLTPGGAIGQQTLGRVD
jgi:cytochrome c peroxidase